jgi:hypothetical protein
MAAHKIGCKAEEAIFVSDILRKDESTEIFYTQRRIFLDHVFECETKGHVLSCTFTCKEKTQRKTNIKQIQGARNAAIKGRINECGE